MTNPERTRRHEINGVALSVSPAGPNEDHGGRVQTPDGKTVAWSFREPRRRWGVELTTGAMSHGHRTQRKSLDWIVEALADLNGDQP